MPVFVGALVGQMTNIEVFALCVGPRQFAIPKLQRACAKMVAQFALGGLHVWVRRALMDGESLKGRASAALSGIARIDDDALQLVPQFAC
jgi:hypothetical protein